jgi:hypothetical protein
MSAISRSSHPCIPLGSGKSESPEPVVLLSGIVRPELRLLKVALPAATVKQNLGLTSVNVPKFRVRLIIPLKGLHVTPEPFVSADEAAVFLAVKRRYLLALARRGIAGAYPLGTGTRRKIWVFRLSELAAAITEKKQPASVIPNGADRGMIRSGSPR